MDVSQPKWLILLLLVSCTGVLSVTQEQVKQWLRDHPEEKSQIWAETRESSAYLRRVREKVRAWVASQEDTEPPTQVPQHSPPPTDSQVAAGAADAADTADDADTAPSTQPASAEVHTTWPLQQAFQRGASSLASQLLDTSQDAQHHLPHEATQADGETGMLGASLNSPGQMVPTPPWRVRGMQPGEAPLVSPVQGRMLGASSVHSTTLDSETLSGGNQFQS